MLDTNKDNSITLYLWQNDKTVVIGRNQNPLTECNCALLEADKGHIARRLSGGGAVYHDLGNLNFTFIYNTKDYDLLRQQKVIQSACLRADIKTEISGRNDILSDGKKFSGNAFYNSKINSYHHGTILISTDMEKMLKYLTPSKLKLESKGVKSVKSRTINLNELSPSLSCEDMKNYMIDAFESEYKCPLSFLDEPDKNEIIKLANKYKKWDYIYGKSFSFSISYEDRFDWGNINILANISEGIIKSVTVYTDSLDWQLSKKIENSLINCKFDFNTMYNNLNKQLTPEIANDILSLIKNNGCN